PSASVPSPKSLANPAESSWTMARRDDDDVSRRYFEEEQRRQGPRGPARLARDFGDGTLTARALTPSEARCYFANRMARRILIGIAGGSGSGKTLVARTIVRELGPDRVVVIHQDSYYPNLEDVPPRDRAART